GLWYPIDSPFDLEAFFDSDYAGASLDMKSTTGDETVIKEWEDRMERAATIASSLEAKQDGGNINRTQFMATLNESFPQETDSGSDPRCQDTILGVQKLKFDLRLHLNKSYDPPLSRVNTLRSGEDNMKLKELMEFCTKLSVRALDNEIGVNAGVSKLMLLSLNLLLPVLVYAARRSLTAVRHKLMLQGITSYCWATAMAKTVNGEHQIQALVDKKKVIITENSVRRDLMLEDAEGIECLPNDNLEGGVKFLMYPRFVQVFLDKQVEGMSKHKGIYVTPSHTKKIFTNMKREGKGFSGRITPLFQTMMVQAPEDMGEDSAAPTDSHSTPIITQPSSSKP
ncbi:hypothetical protein Tco_0869191, partial [Tanacetum coccineum]